jgi:hypothetical protein
MTPAGSWAIEPSGDVSVIPQAWVITMPNSSAYARITVSGSADPPQTRVRSEETSPPAARRWASTPCQIVGTPAPIVTFSLSISLTMAAGIMNRSGITSSAPESMAAYGRPHALAWNCGTTGRIRSRSESAKALPRLAPIECR